MGNVLSCRPESYGKFTDRAYESLSQLGVRNVEIRAPRPDELKAAEEKLAKFGLHAASVTLHDPWHSESFLNRVQEAADAAAALGARIIFTSQKAGDADKSEVYAALRAAGDVAASRNATIVLETHPDLCNNGTVAVETMKGINHPNVQVNFDPANIHYYNQGVDAVQELERVLSYVKAVHLKDTNGGYQTHHFPAIGDGVVDWKRVFALVNSRGVYGPFTLEMEGIAGENLNFEETHARVARSVAYLRDAGLVDA
jgi:L-ribulose-5-phosphate 3-epimerase